MSWTTWEETYYTMNIALHSQSWMQNWSIWIPRKLRVTTESPTKTSPTSYLLLPLSSIPSTTFFSTAATIQWSGNEPWAWWFLNEIRGNQTPAVSGPYLGKVLESIVTTHSWAESTHGLKALTFYLLNKADSEKRGRLTTLSTYTDRCATICQTPNSTCRSNLPRRREGVLQSVAQWSAL